MNSNAPKATAFSLEAMTQVMEQLGYGRHSRNMAYLKALLSHAGNDAGYTSAPMDPDRLIEAIWNTTDPDLLRSRRKNLSTIRNSINRDLSALFNEGKNPEGVTISPDHALVVSQEAKEALYAPFADHFKGSDVPELEKASALLEALAEMAEKEENPLESSEDLAEKLKRAVKALEKSGAIPSSDETDTQEEKEEADTDEDLDALEEEEAFEEIPDDEIEEVDAGDDEELASLDDDEAFEEIPDDEIEEVDTGDDEELAPLEDDEAFEEIPDDEIEEVDAGDDEELASLDDDEAFEEIPDDEIEEVDAGDDEELAPLEDDEAFEEIPDDEIEEVDAGDDEELAPLEDDEAFEEIPDDEIEEVDAGDDEELAPLEDDEAFEEIPDDEIEEVDAGDNEELAPLEDDEAFEEIPDDEIEEVEAGDDEELAPLEDDEAFEEIPDDEIEEVEAADDEDLDTLDDDEVFEDVPEDDIEVVEGEGPETSPWAADEDPDSIRERAEKFEELLNESERYYNRYIHIPAGRYPTIDPVTGEETEARLDEFLAGKYPITNALFEVFISRTGYKTTAEERGFGAVYEPRLTRQPNGRGLSLSTSKGLRLIRGANWHRPSGIHSSVHTSAHHPVVQVSYEDAMAFAAWSGKRLPTLAQWLAAGGKTATPYPWGDAWESHLCNTEEVGAGGTLPVDTFPKGASPFGVYDLMGNAMEWVSDPLPDKGAEPARPAAGGSFLSDRTLTRQHIHSFDTRFSSNILGFRCIGW